MGIWKTFAGSAGGLGGFENYVGPRNCTNKEPYQNLGHRKHNLTGPQFSREVPMCIFSGVYPPFFAPPLHHPFATPPTTQSTHEAFMRWRAAAERKYFTTNRQRIATGTQFCNLCNTIFILLRFGRNPLHQSAGAPNKQHNQRYQSDDHQREPE